MPPDLRSRGHKNHCVTIGSNVLHQYESYLPVESISCINSFCSLRETGGLKINFEIGNSIR